MKAIRRALGPSKPPKETRTLEGYVVRDPCHVTRMADRTTWYERSHSYWSHVPSTVAGMLDGHDNLSRPDLISSAMFLGALYRDREKGLAVDCGSGIGRPSG